MVCGFKVLSDFGFRDLRGMASLDPMKVSSSGLPGFK